MNIQVPGPEFVCGLLKLIESEENKNIMWFLKIITLNNLRFSKSCKNNRKIPCTLSQVSLPLTLK